VRNAKPLWIGARKIPWLPLIVRALPLGLVVCTANGTANEPPWSFSHAETLLDDERIDRRSLPDIDAEALTAQAVADEISSASPGPHRFAVKQETSFNLENSGTWEKLEDDDRLWRLRLDVGGAKSLSLNFSELELPEGGRLWVYGRGHGEVHGPYTLNDRSRRGRLTTPLVRDRELIVELFLPAASEATLKIGAVNVGFRD
jgi:hypothetical protein